VSSEGNFIDLSFFNMRILGINHRLLAIDGD
jgi:hypothetical protein